MARSRAGVACLIVRAAELTAAGFEVLPTAERGNRRFIVVAATPRPDGSAAHRLPRASYSHRPTRRR